MYNPASKKAEEFINHEEILATLNYAEENKHNEVLITELIEKAKLRKGLSHREASVLLACDIEEKNQEIYALRKISTAIELSCLPHYIFPITVSMAVPIAHTT